MILDRVCYPVILFGRVVLYLWRSPPVLSQSVCLSLASTLVRVLSLPDVMYGHTYSKSMDQPGKVGNPARGQLNRENEYFPVRARA